MLRESTKAILVGDDNPPTTNSTLVEGSEIVGSASTNCVNAVANPPKTMIKINLMPYNIEIKFQPQYDYNNIFDILMNTKGILVI